MENSIYKCPHYINIEFVNTPCHTEMTDAPRPAMNPCLKIHDWDDTTCRWNIGIRYMIVSSENIQFTPNLRCRLDHKYNTLSCVEICSDLLRRSSLCKKKLSNSSELMRRPEVPRSLGALQVATILLAASRDLARCQDVSRTCDLDVYPITCI